MSAANIRTLRDDEHEAAAVLLHHCLQATFKSMIPAAALRALTLDRAQRRIKAYPHTTRVIEVDDRLAGVGQWHGDEITIVYVHPDHQRGGQGRALLRALIDGARQQGHPHPWLICLEGNAAARAFYIRLGGHEEPDAPMVLNGVPLPHVKVVF